MYKESRRKGSPSHPRRQLLHKGDKVWRMFLRSRRYLALKAKLLKEDSSFTDPGRTTFLATRCGCLGVWSREIILYVFFLNDQATFHAPVFLFRQVFLSLTSVSIPFPLPVPFFVATFQWSQRFRSARVRSTRSSNFTSSPFCF